jgi:hypothetical protein
MNQVEEVSTIIRELVRAREAGRYVPPRCYDYIYAGLGDFDRAFEWAEV